MGKGVCVCVYVLLRSRRKVYVTCTWPAQLHLRASLLCSFGMLTRGGDLQAADSLLTFVQPRQENIWRPIGRMSKDSEVIHKAKNCQIKYVLSPYLDK